MSNATEILGYHFIISFAPLWTYELRRLATQRAQAVGLRLSDGGDDLRPRAKALSLAGTQWSRLRSGDLRFDVVELRDDVRSIVEVGFTSRQCRFPFGVRLIETATHEQLTAHDLREIVGLWLTDAALVFSSWRNNTRVIASETIASFDIWKALDAMSEFAMAEPSFGHALHGFSDRYPSPAWAADFETTAQRKAWSAHATFGSKRIFVTGTVNLIVRDVLPDEIRRKRHPGWAPSRRRVKGASKR